MDFVTYLFFLLLVALIGITPFFILYGLADFVYLILYKVVGYRKAVVKSNLKMAFPEKSDEELKKIEKASYKNLADIFVESVKGFTISRKAVMKRHKTLNPDILKNYYKQNQPVMILAGHYGNWEWGPISVAYFVKNTLIGFYKPLSNKYMDRFAVRSRAKSGTILASIYKTKYYFENYIDKPAAFVMIADQSPSNIKKAIWARFLNIDTAFLHGPEYYAKKHNLPVLFTHMTRKKRGMYELSFELLTDNPASTKDGEITQMYADKLEAMIRKEPANWLWSHKRWKHRR